MPAKLNWGIIGTRFIAEKFAEQLPEAPGAGLAAVGSCSLEPAGDFCSRHGDRPLGSCDELLADPEVEAISISPPNHLYHEWTLRAFEAGRNAFDDLRKQAGYPVEAPGRLRRRPGPVSNLSCLKIETCPGAR
tara:strand:- start:107 stop:505 length:399 start_codon:yes stop_codon:yes gene_type:complete